MGTKYRVAVYSCSRYNKEDIKKMVFMGFEYLGGIKDLLGSKKRICIKPNLLLPAPPEQAITTHPVFIEAVVELISEYTGRPENILIADSFAPAVPFTKKGMERIYSVTGLEDVSSRTGCRLNYSTEYSTLSYPEGKILKKIEVIKPVIESDIIINLPKFKTHDLTGITGAVKNMFGVVPGFTKVGYHLRFEDITDFASMLLDLTEMVSPAVNIMDGILGIEGDGPGRSGTPRKTGLLMVSDDAMAMDMVMGKLVCLDEDLNPFLVAKKKGKENNYTWDNIKIIGKKLSDVIMEDFELPRTVGQKRLIQNSFASRYIMPFARNSLNPYPYVDHRKCDGCLTCQEVCPRKIVEYDGKRIHIDNSRCIRCFCCSEMCPQGAIEPKYSIIADIILNRMGFGGKKKQ
jgi:uncharacterized protein (DUF362 family)/NAD-dependent dihydropyrimidine dehydrogenase PreA subunit